MIRDQPELQDRDCFHDGSFWQTNVSTVKHLKTENCLSPEAERQILKSLVSS